MKGFAVLATMAIFTTYVQGFRGPEPRPFFLCEQGDLKKCEPLSCAYNAPAHFRVRSDCKCWQIDFNASFLYWQVLEEGLTLAQTAPSMNATLVVNYPNTGAEEIDFNFVYHPGFKLGFGTYLGQCDDWAFNVNLTHLGFHKTYDTTPDSGYIFAQNEWLLPQNGGVVTTSGTPTFDAEIAARWGFKLNVLDFALSRPFYNGNRLILTPTLGARACWISQKYKVLYYTLPGFTPYSFNKSNCWALGAKGGLNGNWLLDLGFRLQGSAAFSTLFTNYHIRHTETSMVASLAPVGATLYAFTQNKQAGRFMTELGLGLGWGSYFKQCQYHADFLLSYDFLYLPNQNVMNPRGPYDLFLQGLTLSARLDM